MLISPRHELRLYATIVFSFAFLNLSAWLNAEKSYIHFITSCYNPSLCLYQINHCIVLSCGCWAATIIFIADCFNLWFCDALVFIQPKLFSRTHTGTNFGNIYRSLKYWWGKLLMPANLIILQMQIFFIILGMFHLCCKTINQVSTTVMRGFYI